MRRTTFTTLACAAMTLTAGLTTATAGAESAPSATTSTRASALAAYKNTYLPAVAVASGSTGNASRCSAGSVSASGQNAALTTINYFRAMNKLKPATLNSTWSANAQQTALMMAAHGGLDHHPTSSWRCYSSIGAQTAGRSNLDGGAATPGVSMARYMDDRGNAGTLGHRRWILDPGLSQVGVGQVGQYGALQNNDGRPLSTPAGSPQYVAWPAAGYVPRALVPGENTWSFSASDAGVDMRSSTVKVTSGGATVPVTVRHLDPGYGKPAVEFVPSTRYAGGADKAFTVTVSGMRKGGVTLPSYTYTTTLFDETKATSPTTSTPTTSTPAPKPTATTPAPKPTTPAPTAPAPYTRANNYVYWMAPTTARVGQSIPFTPTFTSRLGSWSSSMSMTPSGVCSYGTNTIVFKAKGTCTVTVRQDISPNFTAAALTQTITVN